MNDLMNTAAVTMRTREIAELTGKEHKHILRDARQMRDALGLDQSSFGSVYRGGNGQAQPVLLLPHGLTITLVSGYSIQMRSRIVNRWLELEAPAATALSEEGE